jgi:hypothetical protein
MLRNSAQEQSPKSAIERTAERFPLECGRAARHERSYRFPQPHRLKHVPRHSNRSIAKRFPFGVRRAARHERSYRFPQPHRLTHVPRHSNRSIAKRSPFGVRSRSEARAQLPLSAASPAHACPETFEPQIAERSPFGVRSRSEARAQLPLSAGSPAHACTETFEPQHRGTLPLWSAVAQRGTSAATAFRSLTGSRMSPDTRKRQLTQPHFKHKPAKTMWLASSNKTPANSNTPAPDHCSRTSGIA